MGILSLLFGKNEQTDFSKLLQNGAIVVDVRTPQEFSTGHIAKSININLANIGQQIATLKQKNKPIITVCKSGARSSMAVSVLKKSGIEAYNGGAWHELNKQIQNI